MTYGFKSASPSLCISFILSPSAHSLLLDIWCGGYVSIDIPNGYHYNKSAYPNSRRYKLIDFYYLLLKIYSQHFHRKQDLRVRLMVSRLLFLWLVYGFAWSTNYGAFEDLNTFNNLPLFHPKIYAWTFPRNCFSDCLTRFWLLLLLYIKVSAASASSSSLSSLLFCFFSK